MNKEYSRYKFIIVTIIKQIILIKTLQLTSSSSSSSFVNVCSPG